MAGVIFIEVWLEGARDSLGKARALRRRVIVALFAQLSIGVLQLISRR